MLKKYNIYYLCKYFIEAISKALFKLIIEIRKKIGLIIENFEVIYFGKSINSRRHAVYESKP